jgi:phosphohistidine phosphatase
VQVKPTAIHHSGKARARHTALILADFLRPPEGIRGSGGLGPTDNPEVWYKLLAGMEEDVMLVGHLPLLSRLTGMLLAKDKEETIVDFKMGGMVCLNRIHSEKWQIEWMIIPELIRG